MCDEDVLKLMADVREDTSRRGGGRQALAGADHRLVPEAGLCERRMSQGDGDYSGVHLDCALHLACNQVTYYLVSGALIVTIPRQDREQLCPRVQARVGHVYRCLTT